MTKKFVSLFLALTLCLALSVPAFAAGEEPEPAADPAVQTEVETEPADEPVTRGICLHTSIRTDYYDEVDRNNYNGSTHVVKHMKHEVCLLCDEDFGASPDGFSTESHRFRVTEYGVVMGSNGETVTTYLHACILCNYSTIRTYR